MFLNCGTNFLNTLYILTSFAFIPASPVLLADLSCVCLIEASGFSLLSVLVASSALAFMSGLYVFTTALFGGFLKVRTSFSPFCTTCMDPPGATVPLDSISSCFVCFALFCFT